MIDDDTLAFWHTLCLVCMGGNTFFSGATATMRRPNGGVEVTGGERIMSSRMIALSEVIEQERRRGMPVRRVWTNEDQEAIDRLCACATQHVQVKIQLRPTWGVRRCSWVLMAVLLEHANMVGEMVRRLEEVSGEPASPNW
jgi:hypothetical protein